MPKLFRTMKKSEDGKPVVDATGKGLGVRGIPVNNVIDVDLDESGRMILNNKGMSVAAEWRLLPPHLIPSRLIDRFPDAIGSPHLHCFKMGDGPFQDEPVASGLELKRDSPKHGVVVPQRLVPLDQFQTDLAATRNLWVIDESSIMTLKPFSTNPSYLTYLQGVRHLHALIQIGQDDTDEADVIRDGMDHPFCERRSPRLGRRTLQSRMISSKNQGMNPKTIPEIWAA